MPEATLTYNLAIERFESFLKSRSLSLKPRIMFLNPPLDSYRSNQNQIYKTLPPFGLGILATLTEIKEISTNILDAESMRLSIREISSIINHSKPEILGINITSPTLSITKRIVDQISYKPILIIAGGVHPTLMPKHTLATITKLDAVFVGEAEIPWQKFLTKLVDTQFHITSRNLEEIEGVMTRNTDKVNPYFNQDIDSFPSIDYKYFYNQPYINESKAEISLLTSRGCSFNCNYCACPVISNRTIRVRSIRKIVDEIESFYSTGIEYFHIGDDNFTVSIKRLTEFCDELKKREMKIKWKSFSRTDSITPESIKVLKESGCYKLSFGIETGNQRVLESMNKKQDLDDIITAIKLCRQYGIESKGFFMLGYPGETEEEINETISFAKKIDLDSAFFYLVRAYPGTNLFDHLRQQGFTEKELLSYKHIYPRLNKIKLTDRQKEKRQELEKNGVFDLSKTLKYNITHNVTISELPLDKLSNIMAEAYISFYYS